MIKDLRSLNCPRGPHWICEYVACL